ncbi:MAG: energy transducer TonB [gamma proteobacterium endosymbiont of Lamellibrachia anaximandri]|nr:energy transducer TonB [gamma proteobacterium endosymbiont of Lamellibrachia anaximandri]
MGMTASLPQTDRLGITLFLAACLHALLILGVTFKFEDRKPPDHRQQSLEIMVVRQPKAPPEKEEKADFLAQVAQSGGGSEKTPKKPATEAIVQPTPEPAPKQARSAPKMSQPQASPRAEKRLITQTKATIKLKTEQAQPEPKKRLTAAQLLASKNLEIARLTADLEEKSQAYAKRTRRKAVSASTREYKYSAYLESWRRKVERIGNLNYPDEAKRQRLYGNLVLHVAVKADGTIEQVRILHSSGHKLLDDAAIRIVRLAAPYSPFPNNIRKETDVLDITRTWQFLRSNRLGSE